MNKIAKQTIENLYPGGNEVFFSFLEALISSIDDDKISQETLEIIFEQWGMNIAAKGKLPPQPLQALDKLQSILQLMGLARVFEPAEIDQENIQILVLRYLPARYIRSKKIKGNNIYLQTLCALLKGIFKQLNIKAEITLDPQQLLRSDECIISITLKQ